MRGSSADQQVCEEVALLSLTAELLEAVLQLGIRQGQGQGCAPQLGPYSCNSPLLQHSTAGCMGALLQAGLLGLQAVPLKPRMQHIIHAYLQGRDDGLKPVLAAESRDAACVLSQPDQPTNTKPWRHCFAASALDSVKAKTLQ